MRTLLSATLAVCLVLGALAHADEPAPAFRVRVLDASRIIDSRDLLGEKVLVLRFQASYCRTCVREAPGFAGVVARYAPAGVEFVAFHVQDTAKDVRRFMRAHRVTYAVALDPRLAIGNSFGVKGTPYTVVIDRNGHIAAKIHGESAVRRLPAILDALLGP